MPELDVVDVSVLIPTIGRPELLEKCLRSLEACRPRAAEIVVVDQSRGHEIKAVVGKFEHLGARVVSMTERGVALARNTGLREVRHEVVALTDDDCLADPSWIGGAYELATRDPNAVFTGRVLPGTSEGHVPSTREDEEPQDFTGTIHAGGFFSNNAVVPRSTTLELGFDDRFPAAAAEDVDFGYRWLTAGHRMFFEPRLVIWHCDWRTPAQLRKLYWGYGRWLGAFYGKYLLRRDLRVLHLIRWDFVHLGRTLVQRLRGRDVEVLPALLPVLALPRGLWDARRFRGGS